MITYQIGFPDESIERQFVKELSHLPKNYLQAIKNAIDKLSTEPRPAGKKFKFLKPPVSIGYYLAQYRLRVGDYRVLYDIDEQNKKVVLLSVRRRTEKTYR